MEIDGINPNIQKCSSKKNIAARYHEPKSQWLPDDPTVTFDLAAARLVKKGSFTQYPVSSVHIRKRQWNIFFKGALVVSLMAMIQLFLVSGLPSEPEVSQSGSLEAVQCSKKRCGDKDPCCNGQYCCDKKFWPKSQKDCGDDKYVCEAKGCGCKKFEKVWGG